MLTIPAIDILGNSVVRLTKGDFKNVSKYKVSPIEQVMEYYNAGFKRVHIVDLAASKDGSINVLNLITKIKKKISIEIEFGGGIRTLPDVEKLKGIGIDKIIIGSLSISNRPEFEKIIHRFGGDDFIIAADVFNSSVMIKGWTKNSGFKIEEHIEYCNGLGLTTYLCTDIKTDGMLSGPNLRLYKNLINKFPSIDLIASGGVRDVNDLSELKKLNVYGVVVGKAIYEGKIKLEELIKIVD